MAERNALEADWENTQFQWALSHQGEEGMVTVDDAGNLTGLTDAGAAAFSSWFNSNIYGNKNVNGFGLCLQGFLKSTVSRWFCSTVAMNRLAMSRSLWGNPKRRFDNGSNAVAT
jgi:hypothetical protein